MLESDGTATDNKMCFKGSYKTSLFWFTNIQMDFFHQDFYKQKKAFKYRLQNNSSLEKCLQKTHVQWMFHYLNFSISLEMTKRFSMPTKCFQYWILIFVVYFSIEYMTSNADLIDFLKLF